MSWPAAGETAIRLTDAFGTGPEMWLNLQRRAANDRAKAA
jgi:plasmid maintenance system antidote protein VapI